MIGKSLMDIVGEDLAIYERIYDAGGEITPEIETDLAKHLEQLESKCDAYAAIILESVADAAKWRAEAERCAAHARTSANLADNLKARICSALITMGRDKVKGSRWTLRTWGNQRSVEVLATVDKLPEVFVRVVPEVREPSVAAIGEYLKGNNLEALTIERPVLDAEGEPMADEDGEPVLEQVVLAQLKPKTYHVRVV